MKRLGLNMSRAMIVRLVMLLMMVGVLCSVVDVDMAMAAPGDPTCTDDAEFQQDFGVKIYDALVDVVNLVNTNVLRSMNRLYMGIVTSSSYTNAVYWGMALMLIVFAVGFMFGLVQATLAETVMRLVKMGFLFWLLEPGLGYSILFEAGAENRALICKGIGFLGLMESGSVFLNCFLGGFFFDGTLQLIAMVINVGQGNIPAFSLFGYTLTVNPLDWLTNPASNPFSIVNLSDPTGPLIILKDMISMMFNPRSMVIMFATVSTGPFGPVMAGAILWGFWSFVTMVVKALQVYVLSIVVRAILIALAPIFFAFLLFKQTTHLFTGWINQLVSFSLQPVFLFAFLSFFSIMITSSLADMLPKEAVEVCFVKQSGAMDGAEGDIQNWRFKLDGEIFEGQWDKNGSRVMKPDGSVVESTNPFPIGLLEVMMFIILVYLGKQMCDMAAKIAGELASSMVHLGSGGSMGQWFGGGGGGGRSSDMHRYALNKGK